MKAFWHHIFLLISILFLASCVREVVEVDSVQIPDGTPINILLDFSTKDLNEVWLGTKAEANRADESTVRDLYVMIFDKTTGECFYSRYFAYQHLTATLEEAVNHPNEGWFVDNLTVQDLSKQTPTKTHTQGVVKISTESRSNCRLVVLANIKNTLMSLDEAEEPEKYLEREIDTWEKFNQIEVRLQQDLTLRDDLFLMMGKLDVSNTALMAWNKTDGETTGSYGEDFQVVLKPLDAKVKFRIRANSSNISAINPRLWRVFRVPRRSFLSDDPSITADRVPEDSEGYFDTADFYFEGTERDSYGTWEVFSFYMLQNRQACNHSVSIPDEDLPAGCDVTSERPNYLYHRREFQVKDPVTGENGDWYFAKQYATYVQFDIVLTLTEAGINAIDTSIAEALTTEAVFTVHLGDFNDGGENYDDYNTYRGYSYTYNIVVNNSKNIYVEVMGDGIKEHQAETQKENEPGQEGSLLLTTDGIINCDAHYEYHSMVFQYNEKLGNPSLSKNRSILSWHIKSPFNENGLGPSELDENGWHKMPENCDYNWVKFMLNDTEGSDPYKIYKRTRQSYPGPVKNDKATYDPTWTPSSAGERPLLLDINQLVNFLYWQNEKKFAGDPSNLFDSANEILFTAFVDEYYYEVDPFTGELDQDLWRKFVNAKPRELHILSDAEHSKDWESDVITSSHSIIQQSIQTIYNIYSPSLSNIWGTEHNDELHKGSEEPENWPWWPDATPLPAHSLLYNDEENGRLNTAGIWGLTTGHTHRWEDYLEYAVDDNTPEMEDEYKYLAYACMTRNRDNNGNGIIDMDEVRWYTGAINQLVGMWVGNEALSKTARLYQPKDATSQTGVQWRSETVSSTMMSDITNPRVIRAEEGCTKSGYDQYTFWTSNPADHYKVTSVRCMRNVGTYREMGVPTDITYAPVDMMVDQYYECAEGVDPNGNAWPNDDGTYTITFSHLNNKSIREYTDKDLPYHDEYSLHNCVYLSFTAMDKEDDIRPAGVERSMELLNNDVSIHNDICPPGYRVPNMTELLLMSALLPDDYWDDNANYLCRTYFSLGVLGESDKRKTSESKTVKKIGWAYNTQKGNRRVHLKNQGSATYKIRCVQDDHTKRGDISGDIIVENWDHLSRGDDLKMKLNLNSVGAAINNVELRLHYTDAAGNQRTKPIPYTLKNSTLVIKDEEYVNYGNTILSELPSGVYGQMSVHAIVRNTYGTEREFETPIRIESPLKLSLRLLPLQYDPDEENPHFPLLITAYNVDSHHIDSWKLKRTTPSDSFDQTLLLPDYGGTSVTYASRIVYFDNPGASLEEGTYSFQLEVVDNAGNITRSDIVSMDVLKVYYCPYTQEEITAINNSAVSGKPDYYTDKNKIKRWKRQMIQGLDFPSGDFIEANVDISDCIHIPLGDADKTSDDIGLDKIVTIGLNSTDWATNQFNVFYPSCPTSTSDSPTWLYLQPTWTVETSIGYRGYDYSVINSEKPLHLRLDKNGVYYNGNLVDIRKWPAGDLENIHSTFERLMNAHTLFIGSTEGNPSRATYRFVRVVYNGRDSSIRSGNDTFDQDPIHGGSM